MARKPPPPARFPPRLHEVWRLAIAEGSMAINCGANRGTAISMRQQLYALRRSLCNHHQDLGFQSERFSISIDISEATGDFWVRIGVAHENLDDILKKANVKLPDAPQFPLDDQPPEVPLPTGDYLNPPKDE